MSDSIFIFFLWLHNFFILSSPFYLHGIDCQGVYVYLFAMSYDEMAINYFILNEYFVPSIF